MRIYLAFIYFFIFMQWATAQSAGDTFRFPGILGASLEMPRLPIVHEPDHLTRSVGGIPMQKSLKRFCPAPKLQQYADCVPWAVAYTAIGLKRTIESGANSHETVQALSLDPMFVYKKIRPQANGNCFQPSHIEDAFSFIRNQGVPGFDLRYYDCASNRPIPNNLKPIWNPNWHIIPYAKGGDKITFIKQNLAEGSPVVVCLKNPKGGGGHAVCLVSYDGHKKLIGFSNSGTGRYETMTEAFCAENTVQLYALSSENASRGSADSISSDEAMTSLIRFREESSNEKRFLRLWHKEGQDKCTYKIGKPCPNDTNYDAYMDLPPHISGAILSLSTSDREVRESHIAGTTTDEWQSIRSGIRLDNHPASEFFLFVYYPSAFIVSDLAKELSLLPEINPESIQEFMVRKFGAIDPAAYHFESAEVDFLLDEHLDRPVWVIVEMNHVK